MNGNDPQDDNRGALIRIARTLGIPVATFLTAYPPGIPEADKTVGDLDHPAEVVALLRLFVRMKSPEARARCLDYVAREATHEG